MLPSAVQIKQWLVTFVIPGVAASLATWVLGAHVLDIFKFADSQVVYGITQILVWIVTFALGWLSSHHVLKATYSGGRA